MCFIHVHVFLYASLSLINCGRLCLKFPSCLVHNKSIFKCASFYKSSGWLFPHKISLEISNVTVKSHEISHENGPPELLYLFPLNTCLLLCVRSGKHWSWTCKLFEFGTAIWNLNSKFQLKFPTTEQVWNLNFRSIQKSRSEYRECWYHAVALKINFGTWVPFYKIKVVTEEISIFQTWDVCCKNV